MKRLLDIIGALVGLILLSPVIALLWVLIRRNLGAPVLFRQTRPGKDGVPFEMVKFRTMKDGDGPDGTPLPDSERVTGWAQINGRNAISWPQKFELDVWYVENRSLALDLKIIALTVKKVLKRDGISAAGEVTMSKFTGEQ